MGYPCLGASCRNRIVDVRRAALEHRDRQPNCGASNRNPAFWMPSVSENGLLVDVSLVLFPRRLVAGELFGNTPVDLETMLERVPILPDRVDDPLVRRIGISGVEAECAFDLFAARSDAGELRDMKLLDVPLTQFVAIDAGDSLAILQFPEAIRDGFFVRPQSRNSDGDW